MQKAADEAAMFAAVYVDTMVKLMIKTIRELFEETGLAPSASSSSSSPASLLSQSPTIPAMSAKATAKEKEKYFGMELVSIILHCLRETLPTIHNARTVVIVPKGGDSVGDQQNVYENSFIDILSRAVLHSYTPISKEGIVLCLSLVVVLLNSCQDLIVAFVVVIAVALV